MSLTCNSLLMSFLFWPLWSALVCGLFSNYLGSVNVFYFGPGLFYSLTSFLAFFVVKLNFFSTGYKDNILNYLGGKGLVLISCLNMISILMVAFTLWLVNNHIFCLFSSALFFFDETFLLLIMGSFFLPLYNFICNTFDLLFVKAWCDPGSVDVSKLKAAYEKLSPKDKLVFRESVGVDKKDPIALSEAFVEKHKTPQRPGTIIAIDSEGNKSGFFVDVSNAAFNAINRNVDQAIEAQKARDSHTSKYITQSIPQLHEAVSEYMASKKNQKKAAGDLSEALIGVVAEFPSAMFSTAKNDPESAAKAVGVAVGGIAVVKTVSALLDGAGSALVEGSKTMAARSAVGRGIPAMPSIGVSVPTTGIPLSMVPNAPISSVPSAPPVASTVVSNLKSSMKIRAVGAGVIGVSVSSIIWSIFKRDFSTSRRHFGNTPKVDKYQKKVTGFLTVLFLVQSILSISFVYIGINSYAVNALQGAVVGNTLFELFSGPFVELFSFFKIPNNFWNFTMGVSASRWFYLFVMMLFFRGRNTSVLADSDNLWLPYYVEKFRVRVLVFMFLEKYQWFNKLTVLDKELCKIFMYKTFIYFMPFVINILFIREYKFYVFVLGVLIMLLYQYCRFCFLLIVLFFYNVGAYYDLFPMHYAKNYQQFWPILLMLNLTYNILFSVLILVLYTDLYTNPLLDQYLPVITVLFLGVGFNYSIFYAALRCLVFVLVQVLLFLGLDLHKHYDVNRKFLEYNYDFIAFCVVLLYTLLTLLRS